MKEDIKAWRIAVAVGVVLLSAGGAVFAETAGPFSWEFTSTSATFWGTAKINGTDVVVGDVVAAFDPDGVCAGAYTIAVEDTVGESTYGAMAVYGDDPLTPDVDEGAETGDTITFVIWDASTDTIWIADQAATWIDGVQSELNLDGITPLPGPIISVQPDSQVVPFLWRLDSWPDAGLPVAKGAAIVDVKIESEVGVVGFDMTLSFDGDALEYEAAVMGPFLTKAGASLDGADLVSEALTSSLTLHGRCPEALANPSKAAKGTGTLARLVFRTKKSGLDSLGITSQLTQVYSTPALTFASRGAIGGGYVYADSVYFADVVANDTLDVQDIQAVAGRFYQTVKLDTSMSKGALDTLFRADIDGSKRIRINDVQSVAGRWNMEIPAAKAVPSSARLVARIRGNGIAVEAGETVWVEVFAEDAVGLGAFQFDLRFDENTVQVSKVELGDFLESTGNAAIGLGPVTDDGTVRFGAYSLGGNPGATGSGVLVRVQVVAKAEGEVDLELEKMAATDVLGGSLPVTILDAERVEVAALPERFALDQNYPNPFNPGTTIRYDVPTSVGTGVWVRLEVYDMLGQVIRTLVDKWKVPGSYDVVWYGKDRNGTEISAGVYFCRMVAGDFERIRKMVLLK